LSNERVAGQLCVSINTVKSYIRTGYQKMGVDSRSQAVLWGVDHGFRAAPEQPDGEPVDMLAPHD
jgi:DNA-binding CsgD family transcriptional regulator